MPWVVQFHPEFDPEFDELTDRVKIALLMTTLTEKIASLSPEHRELVERRAEELISEERAKRAKRIRRRIFVGNGRTVGLHVKFHDVRKVAILGAGSRGSHQLRRFGRARSRGAGHRRYLGVLR